MESDSQVITSCVNIANSVQGILSESVCWDILEDQLYQAKGKDDKLMNIFQVAAEKQISGRYGDILESCNQSYDNNGLFSHHPTIVPVQPRVYRSEAHRETVSLMQAVLNAATHFNSFPQPDSPELAQFIAAKDDLYIPRHNVLDVRELWPGNAPNMTMHKFIFSCCNYIIDLCTCRLPG